MEFQRLSKLIDGWDNMAALKEPKPKMVRYGVRPQWLALSLERERTKMLLTVEHAHCVTEARYENIAACAECAFAGLLRGGEVTSPKFNKYRDVSRADVKFYHKGPKGPYAVIQTRNTKAKGKKRWNKVQVFLPSGGAYVDPYRALVRMFEKDPVHESKLAETPLFRDPFNNEPITVAQLRKSVKDLMSALGLDRSKYGAHSLRIGGATALYACGVDALTIKTLGRWSSEAYQLYVRQCGGRAFMACRGACSKKVDDLAQECSFIDDDHYLEEGMEIMPDSEDFWM